MKSAEQSAPRAEGSTAAVELDRPRRGPRRIVLPVLALAAFAIVAVAFVALIARDPLRRAVSDYLGGKTLFVDAEEKSVGSVSPGDTIVVGFKLKNEGREPVRILGCRTLCNCTAPLDLPFVLDPKEARDLQLTVKVPSMGRVRDGHSKLFDLPFTVFTSSATQSRFGLRIRGEVVNKPPAAN